jgi:RNA polymerase subunit RPABC4/transcription elongation factor Spt4
MGGKARQAIYKSVLILSLMMMILTLFCAQVNAMQMVNLPKYDIGITVDPGAVDAGGVVHVTSHVTLLYYQMGTDPSVPDIYVEYELKGPAGTEPISSANGMTDKQGNHSADITMPSAGDYTIVVRAYDIAGGSVYGQNEAQISVRQASAATVSPVTATPIAITPLPTAMPPTAKPQSGGLGLGLGTTELLLIGAAAIVLLLVFLAIVAVLAFFLLRKKKPAPVKPAEPARPAPPPVASSRFCMHCGASMSIDAAKCPKCGLTPQSGVDTKQCSNCGTVIPESAKFCYNCGGAQPEIPKK